CGKLTVNEKGELVVDASSNIVFTKPYAYQMINGEKREVGAEYKICSDRKSYGFRVASYNKNYPLIIDPLIASTFVGGKTTKASTDVAYSISKDSDDNIYICGATDAIDFASDAKSYNKKYKGDGGKDVFVLKYKNGDLSNPPAASILFGGSLDDSGNAISLDSNGNVYVVGMTWSPDFPVASKKFSGYKTKPNAYDAFVAKLSNDLSSIKSASFIGGDGNDTAIDVALSSDGNVYVTGNSNSETFGISKKINHGKGTIKSSSDEVFITRLNSDLTSLLSSSFIGGKRDDSVAAIALDTAGNIFIAGKTESSDFPVGSDVYGDVYLKLFNDHWYPMQGFIAKFNNDLSTLLSSTYLGGKGRDLIDDIATDSSDNVYVSGWTEAPDFPSLDPYNYNDLDGRGFITKLDNNLSDVLANTFLEGVSEPDIYSIEFDSAENIYAGVISNQTDHNVTKLKYIRKLDSDLNFLTSQLDTDYGVRDIVIDSNSNVFLIGGGGVNVSKIDGDLSSVINSTSVVGVLASNDSANSLAIDSKGNIYVAGTTDADSFFKVDKTFKNISNDSQNIFVFRINKKLSKIKSLALIGGSGEDNESKLAIDKNNNVYIAGNTISSDFPVSDNAYQKEFTAWGSSTSGFVVKLNKRLNKLLAGTYFGKKNDDSIDDMAISPDGYIYVTGRTKSPNFPVTDNAYDNTFEQSYELFISKFNKSLSNLLSSTFFYNKSGLTSYGIPAIAIDSKSNVFVAVGTGLGIGNEKKGVLKFNNNLDTLLSSMIIDSDVTIKSVLVDSKDNVYISGIIWSGKIPSKKAVKIRASTSGPDVFISMLNNSLGKIIRSAMAGGSSYDIMNSIAIDRNDNIYVIGTTISDDFPTTISIKRLKSGLDKNTFVMSFSKKLKKLKKSFKFGEYSKFIGNAIAVDDNGNILIAGIANSSKFPMTKKAFDSSFHGNNDIFVAKLK
ncbi:MAG: hypothetical protein D6734_02470, partial [Candidatus Schekmanbacteria bacterium]